MSNAQLVSSETAEGGVLMMRRGIIMCIVNHVIMGGVGKAHYNTTNHGERGEL
jgi:hypothetical protein